MAALTITVGAVVALATSNEHSFGRDQSSNTSLYTAEAALNQGVSNIAVVDFPDTRPDGSQPGGNLSGSIQLNGISGTWTAKKSSTSTPHTWVIKGTATSKTGVTRK